MELELDSEARDLLGLEARGGQLVAGDARGRRVRKYHPGRPAELVRFFAEGLARLEEAERVETRSGRVEFPARPTTFPSLEGFAAKIGVSVRALHQWGGQSTAFAEALERAKTIQAAAVLHLAATGALDPKLAMFVLRANHDWRDTRHVELGGGVQLVAIPGGPLDMDGGFLP